MVIIKIRFLESRFYCFIWISEDGVATVYATAPNGGYSLIMENLYVDRTRTVAPRDYWADYQGFARDLKGNGYYSNIVIKNCYAVNKFEQSCPVILNTNAMVQHILIQKQKEIYLFMRM